MILRLTTLFIFWVFSTLTFGAGLEKKVVCAWDPVGSNGPIMAFFADLTAKAIPWGLDLKFVAYEDENLAANDLSEGKCDVAIVTAILSRRFVPFAGTLDAIGGITSEQKMRQAILTISSPKATVLMSHEDYEVVAALPVGSMFAFLNDRTITSVEQFKDKKFAILNGDIQTYKFAQLSGAVPVPTTLSTFAKMFNEGSVDIVLMPALAYNTFELYHGLKDKGGILDIRMFYGMLQAISRKSAFSSDFGEKMRKYMVGRLDTIFTLINEAERTIPEKYWIRTSQQDKDKLDYFYKDIRLALKIGNQFDAKALSLLWKIRCQSSPEREECIIP